MFTAEMFHDPPAAFRGKPFWSWNGKLEREELLRQVHVMKDMGFGGFFMHSRTGLQTEYLSDEWFELINACADEAQRLGLEAWLYDEDRWPSGTAGGLVTADPAHRSKYLVMRRMAGRDYAPGDCVAAFTVWLEEDRLLGYERLKAGETPAPDAEVAVFVVEESGKSSFYNGNTYVDTLSREATDAFLSITHEKYKSRCGARLGRSIKGIFTDEPNRGDLMMTFTSRLDRQGCMVPWTGVLFERYRRDFGRSLEEELPALFFRPAQGGVHPVKWRYGELTARLFLENYLIPIDDWCRENDLILTGHVLHEDSLTCQVAPFGSVMRAYEHMGIPGIDFLNNGRNLYWIAKQLHSAARQTGKSWELSELYGCTGWHLSLQDHKAIGDWQAFYGVNLRCPHLSWYTMAGENKRDCPASIFYQSAWYKEYRHVEAYFARLGMALSQGCDRCGTLVLSPVESVWAQAYPGWADGLSPRDEAVRELERQYVSLCDWLAEQQVDFDYGDEDMTARLGGVSPDGRLQVGQADYHTVVVGGMTTMRASTLKLLEAFRQAGGRIVFAGEPPAYVDCLPSDGAAALATRCEQIPFDKAALACLKETNAPVCLEGDWPDIHLRLRELPEENALVAVIMNMSRDKGCAGVPVRISHPGTVTRLDCRTGKRTLVGGGETTLRLDLAPTEEWVAYIGPALPGTVTASPAVSVSDTMPLTGGMDYELSEPNVCVLDYAALSINGEETLPPAEILRVDREVRARYGLEQRDWEMVQPWFADYVLRQPCEEWGTVELTFGFDVEELPDGPICLALEQAGQYAITVNGVPLPGGITGRVWVDPCFDVLELPAALLRPGANALQLRTNFTRETQLEAVYLLGGFGVRLDPYGPRATLTALPERLAPGDLREQGLPFYGGRLACTMEAELPAGYDAYALDFTGFKGACVMLDNQFGGFTPYTLDVTAPVREGRPIRLEMVLTRRNTFGPLHRLPAVADGYASASFRTAGAEFTDSYATIPSGFTRGLSVVMSRY